ncbi:MAG: alkaline phosphatase family protein [Nocardioides sp.]|uniref:alkaline phosphatase family protein n=1 Tax=Nocardioides sp. TaxID=35761 RepID=UPI003F0194E0
MRPTGFVAPEYGQRSLADVLPAVAGALGLGADVLGPAPSALELPDAGAYVVFLVDGLGAELLARHRRAAPYLASLLDAGAVGTAGVPSTTATSLTSLGTALAPGGHGLVGYTARVPGTDRLLNHLKWDAPVDPTEWQPHPTAFARLAAAGVQVTAVNRREFEGSGLTRVSQQGASYVGADKVAERLAAAVAASDRSPSVTYVYDSDLDWTGHKFGVASRQWFRQLGVIDDQVQAMREALPSSTRLVVVADHGMVDCPSLAQVDVDEVIELRDGVDLMGGEARFRHLYVREGAVDDVVSTWKQTLMGKADVLRRDEAVARGWFGDVGPSVLPRLGDVMVACRGNTGIFSSADFAYEKTMVGLHGSLTADEMLIPFLVD